MPGRMYRRTSTGNGTNTINATRKAFTNARREGRPGSAIAEARTYAAANSGPKAQRTSVWTETLRPRLARSTPTKTRPSGMMLQKRWP